MENNLLKVIKILKETTDELYKELISNQDDEKEKEEDFECDHCGVNIYSKEEYYVNEDGTKHLCLRCYHEIKALGIDVPYTKKSEVKKEEKKEFKSRLYGSLYEFFSLGK